MAIQLPDWQAAILSTLSTQCAARGLELATCEERDPRELRDSNGAIAIDTPAVILERGPFQVLTHERLSRRCYRATEYQWRAYCVARVDATDYLVRPDIMAGIVIAVLFENGYDWGLDGPPGDLLQLDEEIDGEEVD
ncbi:MAG: hypothetical protein GVY09_02960, partial [Gammaproteobacteria bacterium]|nr:hypothetical protein [Gammaproteobacteria bacterium]